MSTLELKVNELCEVDVTVRESDPYTEMVYVNIDRRYYTSKKIDGCSEMFMSATQLEQLGRFLIRKAEEISTAQEIRRKDK